MSVEKVSGTKSQSERGPARPHRPTPRAFFPPAASSLGAFALYSGEIARHRLRLDEYTVEFPGLPDAFRGMRIAQISDIHYYEWTETFFLREVVEHLNALKPDMVVLTGDFVTYGPIRWP